jgi:DNA-binding response OmpR family regulator
MAERSAQLLSTGEPPARDDAHRRVLIVDDEAAILFAYRRLLEKDGLEVDTCGTYEDAVRLLDDERYLVVIVDIRLVGTGNEDGLEVLRYARARQPEAKVILVTGYGCQDMETTTRELGASYYFEKPVEPSVLLNTLRLVRQGAGNGV